MFRPPKEVQRRRLDDRYEVGSDGVIYSDGCALVPINGVGVNIHGKRMKIAYLVARAWMSNQEGRPYVRHVNGDVTDNRPENLEWCERQESKKRGPKPLNRYCCAYNKDGDKVGIYPNPSIAAIETGIGIRVIRRCLSGKQRTAGGFIWRWGA